MTRLHAEGHTRAGLKVIHIIGGLGVGGAETALLSLTTAFQGTEIECQVFALSTTGGMRARFELAGIPLRCFDIRHRPLRAAWNLFRSLRQERPDVVQTWMYHADLIGGVLGRLAGCHAVLWGIRSVGLACDARLSTRLVRRLCAGLSWLVPRKILCVATASKIAHEHAGYDGRRMVIVPNGYDFSRLIPSEGARHRLRQQWNIPPGHRVIGTVGRFCDEKDYSTFISATGRIAREDASVRFLLVGRGLDPGNPELMAWIRASGYADRYTLTGERSDVADCLAAMDLFCLSSRMEAFPNVLVEAMASGLPCVSTDAGDAAMILAGTGVLVPREDEAKLAEGLRYLLARSDVELESLGSKARAQVASTFSIQRLCETMRNLYLGLQQKEC